MHRNLKILAISILTVLAPAAAVAHPSHDTVAGFGAGFLHPFTGLDHLLAMLAVGLWASCLPGTAAWRLPALFPAVMVVGAALAFSGFALPAVEPLILASVIVLGAAAAIGMGMPAILSAALVGVFALAHGYAHGSELPAFGNLAAYIVGFVGATVVLHLAGFFLGMLGKRWGNGLPVQAGATAIAVTGVALLLA